LESNNTATLSTSYFPCIAYLSIINKHENILIDTFEAFQKQTHRNRTYILSANGVLQLVVPIKRLKDVSLPISQTEICYQTPWQTNHLRAIASAYGKSSYFEYYYYQIENILKKEHRYLIDLNNEITQLLISKFKLNATISNTSSYEKEIENDYRGAFDKKRIFTDHTTKPYFQCFEHKFGFQNNLSALDLLFNMGVESKNYL
jgi:hypothetical protein